MFKLGRVLLTSGDNEHLNLLSDLFLNLQAQIVDADSILRATLDDATWIFVDWLLPAMAGIQLVRLLRASAFGRQVRISMILPPGDDTAASRAMNAGADDYIIGPLAPHDLAERIRTYRGADSDDPALLRLGELEVDTLAHSARLSGKLVPLSGKELRLLAHFLRNPDRVFSRADLIGLLGKSREVHDPRTVDAWMSRLRATMRRAGARQIPRTVRSLGYILDTR